MTPLILASASSARARMLQDAGLEFETEPARIDEDIIKESFRAEGVPPRDLADALAEMKARRVGARHPQAFVIGADQVLSFRRGMLDKPKSLEEARAQLAAMRGESHELLSAAVVFNNGAAIWRHIGVVRMTMRPFSDAFLDRYIAEEGEALLDTVGAYRIEGRGAQLFSRVSGDYFSILGLPLLELLGFLRARGALLE